MKKISHSVLFVLLSAMVSVAFAAKYYPPSDIVVTTDPAAAEAVLKQAREIQMQDAQPAEQKVNKARYGKKKTKVRKTRTVTEETSVQ
ncbi:hypothetical protein OFAG_00009 [Oxalobacter formigenes HOxBLS]|uniref:DUF4148 domain-containing protein n=2 Tax=Oxalobacter paraformigenes TaxID=556268 RepID=C3X6U3_9BURK|nr:hypothetical protein [Oxalobacter paraformigenes]EEO26856.2 hypothetical protein OFAG_00009 [Oxalobacter paraformigenes]